MQDNTVPPNLSNEAGSQLEQITNLLGSSYASTSSAFVHSRNVDNVECKGFQYHRETASHRMQAVVSVDYEAPNGTRARYDYQFLLQYKDVVALGSSAPAFAERFAAYAADFKKYNDDREDKIRSDISHSFNSDGGLRKPITLLRRINMSPR